MKFTIITPWFFPHTGGYSTYCRNILSVISPEHEFKLLVINNKITSDLLGLTKKDKRIIWALTILARFGIITNDVLWAVRESIIHKNFDIVHTHGWETEAICGIILKKFYGCRHVHTFHTDPVEAPSIKAKIVYRLLKDSTVTTVSEYLKERIESMFRLKVDKVLIPGIEPIFFKEPRELSNKQSFLTICNMYWEEKTRGLMDLIDRIKERLVIVGTGPLSRIVEQKISQKENIKFLGEIEHGDIPKLLAKCDIYIHSSYQESLGISIIEALAASRPVIALNVGGIKELIDGKNGILIDSMDDLDNAIAKVIAGYKGYAKNAKSSAQRFTLDKFRERLLEVYECN